MRSFKQILFASAVVLGSLVGLQSCNTDPCDASTIVCKNNGSCLDGVCLCASGWEGSNCETQSLTKFLGNNNTAATYSFTDSSNVATCNNTGNTAYTGNLEVKRSTSDSTKLLIVNLGGFGTGTIVNAYITSTNKLTIPSQQITGASNITVDGLGTYTKNGTTETIAGTYTSNDGTSNCTYNFVWKKL